MIHSAMIQTASTPIDINEQDVLVTAALVEMMSVWNPCAVPVGRDTQMNAQFLTWFP